MTWLATERSQTQRPNEIEFHWCRWTLLAASAVGVIALFYAEENWRGKRAWERCKRDLQADGHVLDWNAYQPADVPEELNFFQASKMTEWFGGRGMNEFSVRLTRGRDDFLRQRQGNPVMDLSVVSLEDRVSPGDADLVLDFKDSVLTVAPDRQTPRTNAQSTAFPKIVLKEVPLMTAIKNLARQDHLECEFDPQTGLRESEPQPSVSIQWSNISAHSALVALLNNYNLCMLWTSKANVARISSKGDSAVYCVTAATKQLVALFERAINSRTNQLSGPSTSATSGFMIFFRALEAVKPARIILRADKVPDVSEVEGFFPKRFLSSMALRKAQVEPAGTNSFHIWLPCNYTAAADYLDWCDQFENDFDSIRVALKRPCAKMYGNSPQPFDVLTPNFVTLRKLTQTLAERAQCYLLLKQPEEAITQLTFITDLNRLIDGPGAVKPTTLLTAMIHAAIARLYVRVIVDGLRLEQWHETQLIQIQQQLQGINLLPLVVRGLETQRAWLCHILERATPEEFHQCFGSSSSATLSGRLQDPAFIFLTLAPRGWTYENMCGIAHLEQDTMNAFDLSRQLVLPDRAESGYVQHPVNLFLTDFLELKLTRVVQTIAQNQTLVNEALVACALERYRATHSRYPESLDALSPDFLNVCPKDIIGGAPLKYHLNDNTNFVLYSIGWNQRDDGGVSGSSDPTRFELKKGDWVWPFRRELNN